MTHIKSRYPTEHSGMTASASNINKPNTIMLQIVFSAVTLLIFSWACIVIHTVNGKETRKPNFHT
jgi:hypothetical protein